MICGKCGREYSFPKYIGLARGWTLTPVCPYCEYPAQARDGPSKKEVTRKGFLDDAVALGEDSEGQSEYVPAPIESEILKILGRGEWRGLFQISSKLRETYDPNLDIEEVERACKNLTNQKLLEQDAQQEFFRKKKRK